MTFGDLKERKKSIISDIVKIDLIKQEGNLNHDPSFVQTLKKQDLEELLLKKKVHYK